MSNTDCYTPEKKLTSLEEAVAVARGCTRPVRGVVAMDTLYAAGRVLASDKVSPMALAPFDQSAMDGYAANVPTSGTPEGTLHVLKGRVAAGDEISDQARLKEQEAFRVFTGAPMPENVNAVIMQEHCSTSSDGVVFNVALRAGDNIYRAGEDMIAGLLGMTGDQRSFTTVQSAGRHRHGKGKTEFVPAKLLPIEGDVPTVEILGKGGSARYLPLLMADGLCMIASDHQHVDPGDRLSFLSFTSLSWS